MRPYSVELFDRNLNFICATNIDPTAFEYSYDALNPTTNSIKILAGVVPTPSNPEEMQSWYIRISKDSEEYQGLIKSVARGKEQDVIRYNPLIYLFDDKTRVKTRAVIETASTDDYIRDVIKANFVNNTDTSKNIPHLTVTSIGNAMAAYSTEYEYTESLQDWQTRMEIEHGLSGGQWFQEEGTVYQYCVWTRGEWVQGEIDEETGEVITPGYWMYYWRVIFTGNYAASTTTSVTAGGLAFSYADGNDPYTTISILSDLILPAAQVYFIFCNIKINFEAKTISCEIGLNKEPPKVIETKLPSVMDSSVTIKESKNEVNKAIIIDLTNMDSSHDGEYTTYYMHPNGKFNTTNNQRLLPVRTEYETYRNVTSTAESTIRSQYQSYLDVFRTYAHVDRRLTDSEYSSLRTAVGVIMPLLFQSGALTINILNDPNLTSGSGLPVSLRNDPANSYRTDANVLGWAYFGSDSYDSSIPPEERPVHSRYFPSHVYLYLQVQEGDGFLNYDVYQDITDQNASAAINFFYTTEDYQTYLRILTERATEMYKHQLATKAFAKSKYKNLIEFTLLKDDTTIEPMQIREGQEVQVIHQGKAYNSILTGWRIAGGLIRLTFGTIRLELTKLIKGANL